jgi:hypothetical protein
MNKDSGIKTSKFTININSCKTLCERVQDLCHYREIYSPGIRMKWSKQIINLFSP